VATIPIGTFANPVKAQGQLPETVVSMFVIVARVLAVGLFALINAAITENRVRVLPMSNRFITMLNQMAAWDNLVLAAFALAAGLVLLHHNITTSPMPLVDHNRGRILVAFWVLALLAYLAVAITCVVLAIKGV
jgi:hypothetical protein